MNCPTCEGQIVIESGDDCQTLPIEVIECGDCGTDIILDA